MNSTGIEMPLCIGVTGDFCISCKQLVYDTHCGDPEAPATAPLYDLSCHVSNEFQCRDCLTRAWVAYAGTCVPCAWKYCGKPAGFHPLPSVTKIVVDRDLFEKLEEMKSPGITDHIIGIELSEVLHLLMQTYEYVADQLLDPVELGSVSSEVMKQHDISASLAMSSNPFFYNLWQHFDLGFDLSKLSVTPKTLKEQLLECLNTALCTYVRVKFGPTLVAFGANLDSLEGFNQAMTMARNSFPLIETIYETWVLIMEILVGLLSWRHLERFKVVSQDFDTHSIDLD
jgi:hypothetical protein